MCVVIIPSYQPPRSFLPFLYRLRRGMDAQLLIVDDGSGEAYQSVFDEAKGVPDCTVLHHEKNLGKGAALKTAFRYILEQTREECFCVTADCDGQHSVRDIWRMAQRVRTAPHALLLGCRDFSTKGVPLRSSFGNRVSAFLFRLLYGQRIRDTQTGLRAFERRQLPLFLETEGVGFEYETRMLITCATHGVPMECVPIETTYETGGAGERVSHFSAFRDSFRIMHVLFSRPLLYGLTSTLSQLVDTACFYIGLRLTASTGALELLLCTVLSRLVSSLFNFLLNIKVLFKGNTWNSAWKYYTVWLGRLAVSYAVVCILDAWHVTDLRMTLLKALSDILLSFMTYRLLKEWVFARRNRSVLN